MYKYRIYVLINTAVSHPTERPKHEPELEINYHSVVKKEVRPQYSAIVGSEHVFTLSEGELVD